MNELSRLLELPEAEKSKRGLAHTPGEIAHQPDTWSKTFELFCKEHAAIQDFLTSGGVSGKSGSQVSVRRQAFRYRSDRRSDIESAADQLTTAH